MKIICIGRNYTEHAQELNNEVPNELVFFLKSPNCFCDDKTPWKIPAFSKNVQYECELVYRICKSGKNVLRKDYMQYIDAITLGIDFTARDIQEELKSKRLPWEKAKSFDNAALVGKFLSVDLFSDIKLLSFEMKNHDKIVQQAISSQMIFPIDQIIEIITQYITLEPGDLIFTGTPKGVNAVQSGDKFIGNLENNRLFELNID